MTRKAVNTIMARLAVNESEVHRVREDIREMKQSLHDTRTSLAAINDMMQQVRGGWRALAAAGAVGGAIAAAIIKLVPMVPR